MINILSLPEELLTYVVECLKPNLSHLRDAALICKRLNVITTPQLYQDVVFESTKDLNSLLSFALVICTSPTHASMVRTWASSCADESEDEAKPRIAEVKKAIKRKIDELMPSVELKRACKEIFARDVSDAVNRCLLYLFVPMALPNLRCILYLVDPFLEKELPEQLHLILDALRSTSSTIPDRPFWPMLEEFTLEGSMDKYADGTEMLAVLARLPWLSRIVAAGLGDGDSGDDHPDDCDSDGGFDKIAEDTTDLESIIIQPRCKLKSAHMERLLRAPKALRIFRYNVGHTWAWTPFQTPKLLSALHHQRHSLQQLTLTHNYYEFCKDFGDDNDRMEPMTFSDFTYLQVLEIALPFVFGQDILQFAESDASRDPQAPSPTSQEIQNTRKRLLEMLPESIKTLRFAQCSDIWAARFLNSALIYYLDYRTEASECLKQLEFHFYDDGSDVEKPLNELDDAVLKASNLDINVAAFKGGRLGEENPHEGWRLNQSNSYDPAKTIDILNRVSK